MIANHPVRVRVAAPPSEARRLCARLNRGGISSAPDDGSSRAEVIVAIGVGDLAGVRARARCLCVVGQPGAPLFAAGADEVVSPGEPEILFRRVRGLIERADLNARIERLNERVAALESGLADAAHDIRSPLHTAMGNAEMLAGEASLSASHRGMAAAAVRQTQRALQLAETILEGARRRQGQRNLEPRPLDLGGLVQGAATRADSIARARGVHVATTQPARPVELRADEELLARLLDNLISNAVRHAPPGSTVEVSAWRASPKLVRLSVKDAGEGIAAEAMPKLVAGLGPGRGLRICRDIAERHSGDFWAQSEPGRGSTFFVELPLSPGSGRPQVLLVSDDESWLREVARTLEDGCDVRSTPLSAPRLGRRRTDLVLVETPQSGHSRELAALRTAAIVAQVPVIELPSEVAAARLARLVHLTV
jgi:signal transduction histidine kinase